MSHGFLPRTDLALLNWASAFSQKMAGSFEQYGIPEQLAIDFAAATDAYRAALQTANEPSTRTTSAVSLKNETRATLKRQAGTLSRIIQANPNVNDAMKLSAGLTVARQRTRIGRPDTAPSLNVVAVSGHTVDLRVYQVIGETNSISRGRPRGAVGALIMGLVSDEPDADVSRYQLMGIASRYAIKIQFPAALKPGTRVWLCATWLNNRKETGPASNPISTYLQGGGVEIATSLRIAA